MTLAPGPGIHILNDMIRDLWYAVLESVELRRGMLGVIRLGERLVFWRDSTGKVVCLYDRCAHRGASLAGGRLSGDVAACPFHGLEYDASGRCVRIPANGRDAPVPDAFRMRSYPTHEGRGPSALRPPQHDRQGQ